MSWGILTSFLIFAAVAAVCGAQIPGQTQLGEGVWGGSADQVDAVERGKILKFLANLEQARKIADAGIGTKVTRGRDGDKMSERRGRTDFAEGTQGGFPLDEDFMNDEASPVNPLHGRGSRTPTQQAGKKSKKRACFWKYCI